MVTDFKKIATVASMLSEGKVDNISDKDMKEFADVVAKIGRKLRKARLHKYKDSNEIDERKTNLSNYINILVKSKANIPDILLIEYIVCFA